MVDETDRSGTGREDAQYGIDTRTAGRCADCGHVYAVFRTKEGGFVPAGTQTCNACGGAEFEPFVS